MQHERGAFDARLGVIVLTCLALLLPGCAEFNRDVQELNRVLGELLYPVGCVYVIVLPEPVRDGIGNFLRNLRYGDVVVNQFLQGKYELARDDLGRWIVNSTIGIGGVFDVAPAFGLERHNEDFGQTLAVWGVPQGDYLVLPIVGPTTHRDMVGFLISFFTNPTFWYEPPIIGAPLEILSYANRAFESREGIGTLAREAADPYEFTKQAWLQRRLYLIYDGKPPRTLNESLADDIEDLGLFDEEAAEAEPPPPGDAVDALPGLGELEGGVVESADDLPGLDDLPDPGALEGIEEDLEDSLPGLDAVR